MAPRVFVGLCLFSLLAGCEPDHKAAAPTRAESTPAATPARLELTPAAAQARLDVEGANLEMGETEVNGLRLAKLRCAGVKRPLLGGMAIVGALAERKDALDACAPAGEAAIATWSSEGGPLQGLEVLGSASAKTDACIKTALSKVASPFSATCAAVVLAGEAAGADAAAEALLGE